MIFPYVFDIGKNATTQNNIFDILYVLWRNVEKKMNTNPHIYTNTIEYNMYVLG